jgi:hypothetical protein
VKTNSPSSHLPISPPPPPFRSAAVLALLLFLALSSWQLGLPGLHYDEAAEAGVNAMELLTGAPVTAFRNVAITRFGRSLPVMVQDYIGALNVYLALPALALTGIGVPNLRIVAILIGLATLLLLERATSEYWAFVNQIHIPPTPRSVFRPPHSLAGLFTIVLLVASPSFVFWSRQGIFVTNLTQPLCFWALWQGLRWLRTGRPAALLWGAFASGLAIYAKILAVWVIAPFALLAAGWWLRRQWRGLEGAAPLSWLLALGMVAAFVTPLMPLLYFTWQTGGVLSRITASLDQSYYGVDNLALWQNVLVRGRQVVQSLRGDHFWYLGGLYGNWLAPWLAGGCTALALWRDWRRAGPPLLLLSLAWLCSLVTISDLFITHYALLQPLMVAVAAVSAATLIEVLGAQQSAMDRAASSNRGRGRSIVAIGRVGLWALLVVWFVLDLTATVRYHAVLARSGGLADHSDASYHLAYHLRYNGMGAPLALDWGFAAPVRYLSEGTVRPIEIFGYDSFTAPDAGFAERLRPFLQNPTNVYLLHAPEMTVFAGRREVLIALVAASSQRLVLEQTFRQRDGAPLYELWRVLPE